jgi:alpha-L-rhamnosidase
MSRIKNQTHAGRIKNMPAMCRIQLVFCLLLAYAPLRAADYPDASMREALPVWADGREKEMNLNLGFRGVFQAKENGKTALKIAASTLYRVFVNGEFAGSGPARAAHGYFRVDGYDISRLVKTGENVVAVEVAGYNVNSYYTLDQPSFLLAEVETGGTVALATGAGRGFEAFQLTERLQKVERYSFQRPFTEYYRMKEGHDRWRATPEAAITAVKLSVQPAVKLLPRNVPLPGFDVIRPVAVYAKGVMKTIKPEKYSRNRSLTGIGPAFKGYPETELEVLPSQRIQELATDSREIINKPFSAVGAVPLKTGGFYIYDFGADRSGFIGARVRCAEKTRLYFHFDELLTDGDVNSKKRQSDINNQVVYELEPGVYDLESFETYTFRYLKVMVEEGACAAEQVYLREFAYPDNPKAAFASSNHKLNTIFEAAKQTWRQNSVDIFMDCPSRERAGWLCDSYFSAIMEKEFTGHSAVAHNFYENYALPERFAHLPEGMIPMCYPADHDNGNFIPNWALWFVLQMEDYARRGGDPDLIARLKPRTEKLLRYFERLENEDGLLEKLERWVFVEWSRANKFVQDVNYPSNMMYCAALQSAARLYDHPEWARKAERLRRAILRQSFNGEFFVDNAVRKDGELKVTGNTTEVCQYYAFFCGIATPESHPALWKRLVNDFGPNRDDRKVYPAVFRANAFVGNYLRMDILSRHGLQSQLLLEIQDYFYAMADRTGTLWEHMNHNASCNHGFASYVGHVLYRDVLGIRAIDYINREITVCFSDLVLDRCRGVIPVGDGIVSLEWRRTGNDIVYSLQAPGGYKVKIEHRSAATITNTTVPCEPVTARPWAHLDIQSAN